MFRFTLLSFLLTCSGLIASAQSPAKPPDFDTIAKEIEQVVEAQRQSVLNDKIDDMSNILADNYLSTNADGDVRDKKQTVEFYRKGDLKYEALEFSDMYIRVLTPDAAVAVFRVTTRERYKGQDRSGDFRVTRVYARNQGHWQVVVNHSTSLTQ